MVLDSSSTDVFNNINDLKLAMDNLVERTTKYALQLGTDHESDFNRAHRRRHLSPNCI